MKIIRKIIKISIIGLFLGIFTVTGIYLYARMLPKLNINNTGSYYLYDQNDNLYFQGNGTSKWANLNDISSYLKEATIIIEDKDFYKHHGFDILRIGKAMYVNLLNGKYKEGASTITQQFSKNLYLEFDKTWSRKLKELWYTIQVETHYSKDDILEGYLNCINYGHGMYGIENASNFYFNKKAKDLTLAEATMLVGIPKSPANNSPLVNLEVAKERQHYILKTMLDNKIITNNEYKNAIGEELTFYGKRETINLNTIMYYQDAVLKELKSIKNIESYLQSGIKIYTNLDLKAQESLENSMNSHIIDNEEIQISGIMLNPQNGAIIGLIGGRNYTKSEFNRAISSKRQVGSLMKPFLYYSALENGFTASTSFLSQETSFTMGENNTYAPKNYNNLYANKSISMASAISFSDNIYAVKTHLFLGENNLVDIANRVGIKTKLDPIPSLPLGTVELSHLEITNAYATLATLGIKNEPFLIKKITDMAGNTIYEHQDTCEVVLNKNTTYILNDLLKGTYDYNMIDYTYPTNISIASLLTHDYGIKSGSTDTDNWIIGFNENIVASIWIGYDDNKHLENNDYKYSKKIWATAIENYLKDTKTKWYDLPNNVVGVIVDPINGTISGNNSPHKKILYYIKGTEPNYTSQVFEEYDQANIDLQKK